MIEQSRHTAEEQRAHAARKSKVGLGNCVMAHPGSAPQHVHARWSLESTGISVRSCTSQASASSPHSHSCSRPQPHGHTQSSGKSKSNNNSRNSALATEEAKLIQGTGSHRHSHGHQPQPRYAGEGEEDCEESEHSNSETCASMCETFSFLSVDKKRNSYGKIWALKIPSDDDASPYFTIHYITYWQAAAFHPTFFLSFFFSQSYECVTSCVPSFSYLYCASCDVLLIIVNCDLQ